MTINELTTVVPPPDDPLEAGPIDRWDEIQEKTGCSLPDDYRDFGLAYGTGIFPEQGIYVFNPFAAIFPTWLDETVGIWRSLKTGEGDVEVPFAVFPEIPGLLPWGSDEGGSGLFWLTEGVAEKWPIVIRSHETSRFYRFDMELTTFLSKVFGRQIVVPNVFESEDFADRSRILFEPGKIVPRDSVELMNIYELYRANDSRAGFWVLCNNWVGSTTEVLVKRVAGKTHGQLPPITLDGESAPVTVDVFVDGKFLETMESFPIPESRTFAFADQPDWWLK